MSKQETADVKRGADAPMSANRQRAAAEFPQVTHEDFLEVMRRVAVALLAAYPEPITTQEIGR